MPISRGPRLICAWALIIWAVGISSAHAQDPDRLFGESVSAYQRGQYDSAVVGFTTLARLGIDDARVWYNLGNSHFKSGRIGATLVAYRRGLRLDPRDPDLNANYRYVRLFAADKIDPVGTFFLEQWWQAAMARLSVSESRAIAGFTFWIAALLTVWRIWPHRLPMRTVTLTVVVAGWLVWGLATGASATCYVRDVARQSGAVVAVQTEVRGGPGQEYTLQFVAHDGLEGTVERVESGWYLVRFPNGLKGWVAATAFEIA